MKKINLTSSIKDHAAFIELINQESRQKVQQCYQCGKCSAGCGLSPYMDFAPNQVIRMVQLGLKDQVLNCQSIWLCSYCFTCTVRCPCAISLADIMDALRVHARREGIKITGRARLVAIFNKCFLGSLRSFGRLNELFTMLGFNLKSGKLFNQADAGWPMLIRGKLKLSLPLFKAKKRGQDEIKRIFTRAEEMEGKM